jgi:hypothetical protein
MFGAFVSLLQLLGMEKTLEATLKGLPVLFKEREERLEKREKDLKRFQALLEKEYLNAGESDDVLHLDVGGTHISVLRRTLTQVDGSMLASRFSGRWDDSLEKSSEGRYFIDQPIELVLPLVNYLRDLASETPSVRPAKSPTFEGEMRFKFYRMVEYYGMAPGVYPQGLFHLFDTSGAPTTLVASHPDLEIKGEEFSTYCLSRSLRQPPQYISQVFRGQDWEC